MEKTRVFVFIVRATVSLVADSIFQFSLAKDRKFTNSMLVLSLFVDIYSNKKLDGLHPVPKLRKHVVKVLHFLNLSSISHYSLGIKK